MENWMCAGRCPPCLAFIFLLALLSAPCNATPSFEQIKTAYRPSEAYLLDRHAQVIHSLRVDKQGRRLVWTPLQEVSPALLKALLAAEDRRFYAHHGVDWLALAGAVWQAIRGGTLRGGSTLTMQLAAQLDPSLQAHHGRRGWMQKWRQMRAAMDIEQSWSKAQILEAYLNQVGFRGELQGIAATAQGLFGKQPSGLTEAEALLLAAILPAPNANAASISRRACVIGKIAGFDVDCAVLQRLALTVEQPPHIVADVALAPHVAAQRLRRPGETLTTTLDATLQRRAGDALRRQLQDLAGRNVRDGAALVLDNAGGDILAYVGSAGPASRAGRVDGVRARRQAGSTLKPFLYGLALEKRYLTAASVLDDSPLSLDTAAGLYVPQNYDRDFKGLVSVRTALAGSLNIPAVRTVLMVGVENFRQRLLQLGYAGLQRDGDYYGQALALGSAEVSLLEQANAYRSLANGGLYSPLRLYADDPPNDHGARTAPDHETAARHDRSPHPDPLPGGEGVQGRRAFHDSTPHRVMDAGAAFIIADILSDRTSRAVTFGFDNPLTTRHWSAVKTGTSKDMRDNWCIGYNPRYTVAVWVGNFEGDSMHDVSGVSGAAPAWLEIIDNLPAADAVPPAPPGVIQQTVSLQPAIEPPRREWFLAGSETSLVQLGDARHAPPRIQSPSEGSVIALDPDIPPQNQAVFMIAHSAPAGSVFMLDGVRLATAAKPYKWQPAPGKHRLALLGTAGQELDGVVFWVKGTPGH
ncbi:MAG: penicillin-binding protein 1C [Methylococcaceae bacterium]|nr:MAG: penicillin-binding protein 1C [Methylococcaceae bacterium]